VLVAPKKNQYDMLIQETDKPDVHTAGTMVGSHSGENIEMKRSVLGGDIRVNHSK
jgi:hypothetical protein